MAAVREGRSGVRLGARDLAGGRGGMAHLRAARTTHGAYSAQTRALNRHGLTALSETKLPRLLGR